MDNIGISAQVVGIPHRYVDLAVFSGSCTQPTARMRLQAELRDEMLAGEGERVASLQNDSNEFQILGGAHEVVWLGSCSSCLESRHEQVMTRLGMRQYMIGRNTLRLAGLVACRG